jgi:hypothetical protein
MVGFRGLMNGLREVRGPFVKVLSQPVRALSNMGEIATGAALCAATQ